MRLATTLAVALPLLVPSALAFGVGIPDAGVAVDLPLVEPVELGTAHLVIVTASVVQARPPDLGLDPRIDGLIHLPRLASDVHGPEIFTGLSGSRPRPEAHARWEPRPAAAIEPPLPRAPEPPRSPPLDQGASRLAPEAPIQWSSPRTAAPLVVLGESVEPPAEPRGPTWTGALASGAFLLVIAPWLLYHHLRGSAIAEKKTRRRLRTLIGERPGLGLCELASALGIDPSTARYHLLRLGREGHVIAEGAPRSRFFPATDIAPDERARVIARRRHALLYALVEGMPGVAKVELRARLAISRTSFDAHLRGLSAVGLVRLERDGRSVRVFPISF